MLSSRICLICNPCRLVSWQTVSSQTEILLELTIASSGLQPTKRSEICLTPVSARSQYKSAELLSLGLIKFAMSFNTLLCRSRYLASTSGQLQLERTCLFDCIRPHLGAEISTSTSHIFKFLR